MKPHLQMSELLLASLYSFKFIVHPPPLPQCPPKAIFQLAIFCAGHVAFLSH